MIGDPRSHRRIGADAGGGRGIRIDTEINVTKSAQLSLKEDLLAALLRLIQIKPCVADVILHLSAELLEPVPHLVKGHGRRTVHAGDGQVLPVQHRF